MTPATWARTSTRRDAAACPTNSKRAETVSGATVSTETSGGGGAAAVAARRHAQPPCRRTTAPTAHTAVRGEHLVRTTTSDVMDLVQWKYRPAAGAARPCRAFLRVGRFLGFGRSCREASGRSAARLARLVRAQEVGGSNPLAPTHRRASLAMDSVAGLFLPQSPWCEFRCEFLPPLAAHDPLRRVQHDLPHGFGVDLLVRSQERLRIPPPSRRRDVLHGVPLPFGRPLPPDRVPQSVQAVVLALRAES